MFGNARNIDARYSQMTQHYYPNGVVHHDSHITHLNHSIGSHSNDMYSVAPSQAADDGIVGGIDNPMCRINYNRSITHTNHSHHSQSGDIYSTGNSTSLHTAQSASESGSGSSPWGDGRPTRSGQRMRRSDQFSNPTSSHDPSPMPHGPLYDEPAPVYTPQPSYTTMCTMPSMPLADAKAYLERSHPTTQINDYVYQAPARVAGRAGGQRKLPTVPAHTEDLEKLQQLCSMGCTDTKKVIQALEDANGDVDTAAMILFPKMY